MGCPEDKTILGAADCVPANPEDGIGMRVIVPAQPELIR